MSVIQSVAVLMALAVVYQIATRYQFPPPLSCAAVSDAGGRASCWAVARVQREEGRSMPAALVLLLPQLVLAAAATVWVVLRPDVLAAAPHRVLLLLGHVFANLTVRATPAVRRPGRSDATRQVRLITGHLMHQQPAVLHLPTLLVPLVIAVTALFPCARCPSPVLFCRC
jgi:hypothetical protein